MPFQIIITRDFNQMSKVAADLIIDDIHRKLSSKPEYVLGLATGHSPKGLYKHLAEAANAGEFDSARLVSFNLDEYVGLPGENAQQRALNKESYTFYMIQELFGLLKRKFRETHIPGGTLIDPFTLEAELKANPEDWRLEGNDRGKAIAIKKDAASKYLRWIREEIIDAYAEKIRKCGGIDLQIVSAGGRGHVGFHEAGIPFAGNDVFLIRLDDNTIENAVIDGHFESKQKTPQYAVSMGAELIYQAQTVLLVASGNRKADVLADALLMEPDCSMPISYAHNLAQRGGRVVWVIDQMAAAAVIDNAGRICRRGIEIEDRRLPAAAHT